MKKDVNLFKRIKQNRQWIFSGIGAAIIASIIPILWRNPSTDNSPVNLGSQITGHNITVGQGTIHSGNTTINYNLLPSDQLTKASEHTTPDKENHYLRIEWNKLIEQGRRDSSTLRNRGPRYSGILTQLDPIDARILVGIAGSYANTNLLIASEWGVTEYEFGLGLQNIQRLGLVKIVDSKGVKDENERDLLYKGADRTTGNILEFWFRVNMTALGWDFLRQVGVAEIRDDSGKEWLYIDWKPTSKYTSPTNASINPE